MNFSQLVIAAIIIFILDIFFLIWLSGKFVGIQSLPKKDIGILGLAIIMLSWLIGTAFACAPLIIKPFMILLAFILIIYFFILIFDTHILKATAAGLFFLLCQVVLLIVVLREFWTRDLLNLLKYIFFNSY